MYWSHAGRTMELQSEGVWWGAIPESQLRSLDPTSAEELERSRREEWTDRWADRRQELVFIGQSMDEEGIRAVLDACLLDDEELEDYWSQQCEAEKDLPESTENMFGDEE